MTGSLRAVVVSVVAVAVAGGLAGLSAMGLLYGAGAAAAAAALLALFIVGAERAGYAALGLAMATAPMYRGVEGISGGVGTPTDLLAVVGLLLLLPTAFQRKLRLPPTYVGGLAVVAAFGLLGCAAADLPVLSTFFFLQWMFYLAVLPILIAWLRPERRIVVALLWAYLAGHVVSTGYAFVEGPTANGRYDGLTHHVNAFGIAGIVSVAIVLYLFWHHRDQRIRVGLLAVGVLAIASITLSGSRAALAVAAVLILMVPVVERSAIWGFVYATLGALAVFLLPLAIDLSPEESALGRLGGGGTATVADQQREDALSNGVEQFSQSPIIGSGFVDIELIHLVYLEVAVATGVFGALAYLVVLLKLALPILGSHPDRRLCYLAWAFIGIAPAIPGLWDRTIWVPLALAILPALGTRPAEAPDGQETSRDVIRWGPSRVPNV